MLIEAPIGHLEENSIDSAEIDWVDLSWNECFQRAFRKKSRLGRELRILLKIGSTLRHGDILLQSESTVVAVNVLPCETLVIRPRDSAEHAAVAYKLGDLHVPMQWTDGLVITIPDGPTEAAMNELGIPYEIIHRRFEPTHRSVTELVISSNFKMTTVKPP